MIRAHQPGSEPIDIPETIPNPVVLPKPTPNPREPPPKEPVRTSEKVPRGSTNNQPGDGSIEKWANGVAGAAAATIKPEVS